MWFNNQFEGSILQIEECINKGIKDNKNKDCRGYFYSAFILKQHH
ncbi:9646_t:CDS:2, partial [Gigaspora margarita]